MGDSGKHSRVPRTVLPLGTPVSVFVSEGGGRDIYTDSGAVHSQGPEPPSCRKAHVGMHLVTGPHIMPADTCTYARPSCRHVLVPRCPKMVAHGIRGDELEAACLSVCQSEGRVRSTESPGISRHWKSVRGRECRARCVVDNESERIGGGEEGFHGQVFLERRRPGITCDLADSNGMSGPIFTFSGAISGHVVCF